MSIFLVIWLGGLAIVVLLSFVQTVLLIAGKEKKARMVRIVSRRWGEDILPGIVMAALLTAASLWFLRSLLKFLK